LQFPHSLQLSSQRFLSVILRESPRFRGDEVPRFRSYGLGIAATHSISSFALGTTSAFTTTVVLNNRIYQN